MTDTTLSRAVELMAGIRYQVYRPAVTTMGACPRCGAASRGAGTCADCIGNDLDALLGTRDGVVYVACCRAARAVENTIRADAEAVDAKKEAK